MLSSVIVTTHNREPEILKETLDSIVAQTYNEIEIIVVNDSPQYSRKNEILKLIDSYKVQIIYVENKVSMGANYSRNLGAAKSNGEVLSFVDDDDYWALNRMELVMREFFNGADIVYSDYYIFNNKYKKISKRIFPSKNRQLEKILDFNFLGGFSNVSIRKSAFDDVDGLDESLKSYQDQDLFIRLILRKVNISYISELLSYYRINSNSISLNPEKKISGLNSFLTKFKEQFSLFPDMYVSRLESELVYAAKQGWFSNCKVIVKLLKPYESSLKIYSMEFIGVLKYVIIKIFKYQ